MVSTVLYCLILYCSVAALLIMTSIVLHRTWGVTPYLLHTTSVDKVLYMKIDRLDETNTMKQSKFYSEVVCEKSYFWGPISLIFCVRTSLAHILPQRTPNSACRLSLNMILP